MSISKWGGNSLPCPNRGVKRARAEWCAGCYGNIRGRTNWQGHLCYQAKPSICVPWEMFIMRKPDAVAGVSGDVSANLEGDKWLGKYKHVCEYLVTTKWDDGSPREPSAISVSVSDGALMIALNDKDLKQSIYTSAETLQEALKLMEDSLASSKVTWRPWKAGKRK